MIKATDNLCQSETQHRLLLNEGKKFVSMDHLKLVIGEGFHACIECVSRKHLDETVKTICHDRTGKDYFSNTVLLKMGNAALPMDVNETGLITSCKYYFVRQESQRPLDRRQFFSNMLIQTAEEVIHRYSIEKEMLRAYSLMNHEHNPPDKDKDIHIKRLG